MLLFLFVDNYDADTFASLSEATAEVNSPSILVDQFFQTIHNIFIELQ